MKSIILCIGLFVTLSYGATCPSCQKPSNWTTFTRYTVADVVDDIKFYFRDRKAPPDAFINDGSAIPTMRFETDSVMRVTFMYEGAGNRNQLGYFTYTTNQTNNAITIVNETLLFPDILDDNCLYPGMTVTTPVIPAGTYFGFYLISNGLCGGTQKFYTISSLNTPNDKNLRHVGMYVDNFRELLIIGFEDLLLASSDRDFEDTMFIFDSSGLNIQFDGVPFACTNPPCRNGGVCNYATGLCNCTGTNYYRRSCLTCSCSDGLDCTQDYCNGTQCIQSFHSDSIAACLANQTCSHGPCLTSAPLTTGIFTTGMATTRAATTGIATTGMVTTGQATTGIVTTGVFTTGIPTTGIPTTGVVTTAVATTAHATTGEIYLSNSNHRPTFGDTLESDEFDTETQVPEDSAPLTTTSLLSLFALYLIY